MAAHSSEPSPAEVLRCFYAIADVGTPSSRFLAEICDSSAHRRSHRLDRDRLLTCATAAQRAAAAELRLRMRAGADPGEAWSFVFRFAHQLCAKTAREVAAFRERLEPAYWVPSVVNSVRREWPWAVQPTDISLDGQPAARGATVPDLTAALHVDRMLRGFPVPPDILALIKGLLFDDLPYPPDLPVFRDRTADIAALIAYVADEDLRRRLPALSDDARRQALRRHPIYRAVLSYLTGD
jgi:hypothetical protein